MHSSALDVRTPFTRQAAVAAGIHPNELRTTAFRRLFRGVYLSADVAVTDRLRALGALAAHPPGAAVSHASAAELMGLPVPRSADVHVTVRRARDRRRSAGICSHVCKSGFSVSTVQGVSVTAAAHTFLGLAAILHLVQLVALGDAMLAAGLTTSEQLKSASSCSGCLARARTAANLVRAGVDSPMETRLRLLIVLGGLPEPVVNHIIRDERGRVRYRLDLSYPELKLIIEYDGRQHAEDATQWHRDLQRREWLDAHGWRIIVVTARDLFNQPDETLGRIHAALRERRLDPSCRFT